MNIYLYFMVLQKDESDLMTLQSNYLLKHRFNPVSVFLEEMCVRVCEEGLGLGQCGVVAGL